MKFLLSKCGKVALSAEDDKRIVMADGFKLWPLGIGGFAGGRVGFVIFGGWEIHYPGCGELGGKEGEIILHLKSCFCAELG